MDDGSARRAAGNKLEFEAVHASRLRVIGAVQNADARAEFRRRIEQLDVRIRREKLTAFTVDVRKLNFVDSSALRLFIDWVSLAQSGGYQLVFIVDNAITWHRLSFSVLKSLAPSSVRIIDANAEDAEAASTPPTKGGRR